MQTETPPPLYLEYARLNQALGDLIAALEGDEEQDPTRWDLIQQHVREEANRKFPEVSDEL